MDQNKRKYIKILKTRFVAFLDSYYITVDESIQKLQSAFTINYVNTSPKPPKLSKLKTTKNINEALQLEHLKQKEYFERVFFYEEKLDGLICSLGNMGEFLTRLEDIFQIMLDNLQNCEKNQEKKSSFFVKLFRHMIDRSLKLQQKITHLSHINQVTKTANLPQLLRIKTKIGKKKQYCIDLLDSLKI